MTNIIGHKIGMSLVAALAGVAILAGTMAFGSTGTAEAHSTAGVPYHVAGSTTCSASTFRAYTPSRMRSSTGAVEIVNWSPDLYKYTSAGWQLVDGTRPWYWAAANSNGLIYQQLLYGTWFNSVNGFSTLSVPFFGLTPGYYAVKHYFRWSASSISHSEWSSYCFVS